VFPFPGTLSISEGTSLAPQGSALTFLGKPSVAVRYTLSVPEDTLSAPAPQDILLAPEDIP
jgi:hypothetical protein